ncbi:MAG: hypothetical protein ACH350_06325 [Parachlamydiaceae bacterium]
MIQKSTDQKNEKRTSIFWRFFFPLRSFCPSLIVFIALTPFFSHFYLEAESIEEGKQRLTELHSKLQIKYGSFAEEYPEQLMSVRYISNEAKVLEIGGNIGRNSCVIGSLLKDSKTLVVSEPCLQDAGRLQENRDLNKLEFGIEPAAVSKVKLIQSGWKTIPSSELLPGFSQVNIISFSELEQKYGIQFDTLVVDCEGALYQMLLDDPKMLDNIKLIIIENDFDNIESMKFVHEHFKKHGLQCVYNEAGGWGPCYGCFYQVWKK